MPLPEFFEHTIERYWTAAPFAALYHYTSTAGAKNILSSQKFWSTAHTCTNDEAELKSARSIVIEVVRQFRQQYRRGTAARVLDGFIATYPNSIVREIGTAYLTCFSVARDNASQWRRYGDDWRGTCLGVKVLNERGPKNPDAVSGLVG